MAITPHSDRDSARARFGTGGQYTVPFLATEQARYQLLQAVRRRCPQPLLHLRNRIFSIYSQWAEDLMERARTLQQWNKSAEGAEEREAMVDVFKRVGLTEAQAQFAAEGRPVVGVDADDSVFNTFMVLQYHLNYARA